MINRLIQAAENITVAVLNRFNKHDHNIDGSHRPWVDSSNFASFSAAVDACGPAGSNLCTLVISKNMSVGSNKTIETHITLEPKNGGKLDIQTGVVVTMKGSVLAPLVKWIQLNGTGVINFQNRFMPYVVPQWWGAKADGVTDDDEAIQAALDAATDGIPVYFPAGTYLFDTTLLLPEKCQMIGDGIPLTILKRKAAASGIALNSTADADDIILIGFTLDCNSTGTDGINLGNGTGTWGGAAKIDEVIVINCSGGNDIDVNTGTLDKKIDQPLNNIAFRVTASGQQSIPDSVNTKITAWNTTVFDIRSSFDLGNNKFLPDRPGVYWLNAIVGFPTGSAIPDQTVVSGLIFKNGSIYANFIMTVSGASQDILGNVSCLAEANGTTDEFDVRIFHEKGSNASTTIGISFEGFKIK